MTAWTVTYMDRKGAGCSRTFSDETTLERFISKLHAEATIRRDGHDIGSVYRTSGEVDDRRVKWLWNFENEFGMATPPVHEHRCHICDQPFACIELECGILDKFAVCEGAVCLAEWDSYSEKEEDEPHPMGCICREHE